MTVYFILMWTGTFFLIFWLSRRRGGAEKYGYKMAVVQSFTAGSNKYVFLSQSIAVTDDQFRVSDCRLRGHIRRRL